MKRRHEYEKSHDGRPPVRIVIEDLEVTACTNPDCHPEHPGDTVLLDDAAIWRITVETYRQLGLLTPAEIRESRRKLGLSQQQLQELLGLGGNSLSRWEKGRIYQSRAMDTFLRTVFSVPEALAFLQRVQRTVEVSPASENSLTQPVYRRTDDAASECAEPPEPSPTIYQLPYISPEQSPKLKKRAEKTTIDFVPSAAA